MNKHLIIGASHALYMAQALGNVEADLERASAGPVPIDAPQIEDTVSLLLLSPKTNFLAFERTAQGLRVQANQALLDPVRAHDRPESKVMLLINGNEHNSRHMLAHAVPYDFHHPQVAGMLPGRQVVPASVMREGVVEMLVHTQLIVSCLAQMLPRAAKFFIAPPPPIPSAAQIRGQPEVFDFSQREVEHARVRLKVYELTLERLGQFCAEAGVTLLPPPAQHRDAEGFLVQPLWHMCTHALPAYYDAVYAALGIHAHASV
jgi:hypothetical protein